MSPCTQLQTRLQAEPHNWLVTGVAGFIGSNLLETLLKVEDAIGKLLSAYAAVIPKWIASMIKGEPVFINGDGETSRDFCFIANAVQANLLAASTQSPEARNQVYNVAVGERTTLNELFAQLRSKLLPRFPHLQDAKPQYRDFRAGDVRHSLADISKAANRLGYAPTQRISEGLELAMPWYIAQK